MTTDRERMGPAGVFVDGAPPVTLREISLLYQSLAWFIESDRTSVELVDLLGYSPNTWHREASRRGLLFRERKQNGNGHRYWLVKRP